MDQKSAKKSRLQKMSFSHQGVASRQRYKVEGKNSVVRGLSVSAHELDLEEKSQSGHLVLKFKIWF